MWRWEGSTRFDRFDIILDRQTYETWGELTLQLSPGFGACSFYGIEAVQQRFVIQRFVVHDDDDVLSVLTDEEVSWERWKWRLIWARAS